MNCSSIIFYFIGASPFDSFQVADVGDVAQAWREGLVSCPARYWLARILAGTLSEGPKSFIEFHLEEMQCEWCLANKDDLVRAEQNLDPILDKVRASTVQYLRSKTLEA